MHVYLSASSFSRICNRSKTATLAIYTCDLSEAILRERESASLLTMYHWFKKNVWFKKNKKPKATEYDKLLIS